MSISDGTYSEIKINGSPIDWEGYKSRKDISPKQGAKLAHRIDPNLWPDKTNALGEIVATNALGTIPDNELKAINRLAWKLENKLGKVFTLQQLLNFLQSYEEGEIDSSSTYREFGQDGNIEPPKVTIPFRHTSIMETRWSTVKSFNIPLGMLIAVSQSDNTVDPIQSTLDRQLDVLKKYLSKQDYYIPAGVTTLPKGVTHNRVHIELNKESTDKDLFDMTLETFKRYFWQKQKIAKLKSGR
jgi:hypothetical protein